MFVGHSLLAFVLVAVGASALAVDRRRAIVLGVVAGAFAAVPDADMVYALSGLFGAEYDGVLDVTGAFWAASTVVHRSMTHSIVVAPVAAVAFGLFTRRTGSTRLSRGVAAILLAAVTGLAASMHGPLGVVVFVAFAAMGMAVAWGVRAYTTLGVRETVLVAFVGLASHPFGDVFTGDPPRMLWPFEARLLTERVALATDPTLHLLSAFAVELAVVVLAFIVYTHLADRRVSIDPRSTIGVAYGAVVVAIPPPTLAVSYHFVFSILGVGVLLTTPHLYRAAAPDGGIRATTDRVVASVEQLRRPDGEDSRSGTDAGAAEDGRSADGWTGTDRFRRDLRALVGGDDGLETDEVADRVLDVDRVFDGVATGLAAITFALLAYTAGYLLVG